MFISFTWIEPGLLSDKYIKFGNETLPVDVNQEVFLSE